VSLLTSTYFSSASASPTLASNMKSVVTVKEFYMESNAGFRWSERLVIYFYPTFVGHIHLDKHSFTNYFSLRLLYI
jgi:hypothetical protein